MYTWKDAGNRLEQDVFRKLQDPQELVQLKADTLMFHHVYADLSMLAKSADLNKSSLDMNERNLELQHFLQEVEHNPQVVIDGVKSICLRCEIVWDDES